MPVASAEIILRRDFFFLVILLQCNDSLTPYTLRHEVGVFSMHRKLLSNQMALGFIPAPLLVQVPYTPPIGGKGGLPQNCGVSSFLASYDEEQYLSTLRLNEK